jgi:hypothetical protein
MLYRYEGLPIISLPKDSFLIIRVNSYAERFYLDTGKSLLIKPKCVNNINFSQSCVTITGKRNQNFVSGIDCSNPFTKTNVKLAVKGIWVEIKAS